jgi:hypothetical protein
MALKAGEQRDSSYGESPTLRFVSMMSVMADMVLSSGMAENDEKNQLALAFIREYVQNEGCNMVCFQDAVTPSHESFPAVEAGDDYFSDVFHYVDDILEYNSSLGRFVMCHEGTIPTHQYEKAAAASQGRKGREVWPLLWHKVEGGITLLHLMNNEVKVIKGSLQQCGKIIFSHKHINKLAFGNGEYGPLGQQALAICGEIKFVNRDSVIIEVQQITYTHDLNVKVTIDTTEVVRRQRVGSTVVVNRVELVTTGTIEYKIRYG